MFEKLWHFLFPSLSTYGRRTVRYAFNTMLIGSIIAGFASVITENTSYLTIKMHPQSVTEGESFTIEVFATAHTPVNAVDVVLDYPESQMLIKGIDTGTSVITLWAEKPYVKDGHVYLRGGTFKKGFLGEHLIATIRAEAKSAGIAHITAADARFIAGDGLGTEVAVDYSKTGEVRIALGTTKDGKLEGGAKLELITDLDGDGNVDLSDISSFMSAWLTKRNTYDFNGDGRMTFRDFSILLSDSFFN